MSTITTGAEGDAIAEFAIPPEVPVGRSVGGMNNALLRWLRGAAWRILDMGTEFDTLD